MPTSSITTRPLRNAAAETEHVEVSGALGVSPTDGSWPAESLWSYVLEPLGAELWHTWCGPHPQPIHGQHAHVAQQRKVPAQCAEEQPHQRNLRDDL